MFGVVVFVSACGSKSSAMGAGDECFLATDCAPGLICIEQANKTRICSDDLSRVAGRPPPEGGAEGDAANEEGGTDGSVADRTAPPDTGVPDTNTPPPDTGAPPDSGDD
ncbi:MAG: hypothetical protein K0S65_1397 [Labilithrix sp.]|nr:hypothetical protein [Labilithrix sp.]